MKYYLQIFNLIIFSVINRPGISYAENSMMGGMCPMCGAMGSWGMFLSALLIVAVIGVLVALAVFLWRKNRHSPQGPSSGSI